jgi:hypothetical protein
VPPAADGVPSADDDAAVATGAGDAAFSLASSFGIEPG